MNTNTDHKGQRLQGIVLDVDGTLLDPEHRIAPATAAAVRRARSAGLHVLLASGRSARAMVDVVAELELDDGPTIAFNGALTFRLEDGAIHALAETPLARDAAVEALALARERGIEVGWFTRDGWRASALGPGIGEEAGLTGEPPLLEPGLPDGAPAPFKLMCIAADGDGSPALHALRERLPPGVSGQFSHPRYLELIAAGVDKASALDAACAALGLSLAQFAALGDQENDIAMLRAAGIGIAMGNAEPAVIAAADRVTDTNARDGAARAIDALLDGR
ncbi:MAG TPA: Cof-type HAD-IIB family hydrolase [Solirubrobacteraceae bacterium]|nr:Cof-type HAD-IIB family hydrolase [Solirubrobacteraceae bacterium]